ncbi:MAG TPA: type III-A CRISPR-associated RAMP protein Csm3 [Chromatiales bacterium]|nr:type III-A CRISPR-associated RAMP protein Csm3 [Chromatiales bacterium]
MGRIDKLVAVKTLTGIIRCVTGLHIGAGKEAVEIGGMDLPVIRNPVTGEPIIPGSSLKGKVRSLLEWHLGKLEPDGRPWGWGNCAPYPEDDPILIVFGSTHPDWEGGPTRALFRDAELCRDWVEQMHRRGLPFTEEKTEVTIDRIRGKALDGGLHTTERVPAGARFRFEIQYRVFSVAGDNGAGDEARFDTLLLGLRLLEHDALGGCGSRGYGRVKFEELMLDGTDIQERFERIRPAAEAA